MEQNDKQRDQEAQEFIDAVIKMNGIEFVCNTIRMFAPHILLAALEQGKLDIDRLNDLDYLRSVLLENLDSIKDLSGTVRIDSDFMEAARAAANANQSKVVLVLIATIIEHRLNKFYVDILSRKGFSTEEVNEIIRSSNIPRKLGWLLSLSTGYEISDDLRIQIEHLIRLRNNFVHYRSLPVPIDDIAESTKSMKREVESLKDMLGLPDKLQEELDAIDAKLYPEFERLRRITEAWFGKMTDNRIVDRHQA